MSHCQRTAFHRSSAYQVTQNSLQFVLWYVAFCSVSNYTYPLLIQQLHHFIVACLYTVCVYTSEQMVNTAPNKKRTASYKAWNNIKLGDRLPYMRSLITRFMGPTWGPSGADRTQMGPTLAPWTLLSGVLRCNPVSCCCIPFCAMGIKQTNGINIFSTKRCVKYCLWLVDVCS